MVNPYRLKLTHVDVSDSQQNLGVRRPSYSNNALNAIRWDKGSLLPSWHNLDAITIKPSVVLVKKVSTDRNHLSRRKLSSRAGGLRRAETKCENCVGGTFLGHQVAMGVTGVTSPCLA